MSQAARFPMEWETHLTDAVIANPPDRIVLTRNYWKHLFNGHLVNREEPWCDWLSAEYIETLRERGPDAPVSSELAERIGEELQSALQKPLFMTAWECELSNCDDAGCEHWVKVTEPGIIWIAHRTQSNLHIRTAYIPDEAASWTVEETRWTRAVRTVVFRYALRRTRPNKRYLPSADDVVERREADWVATQIQFVSPAQWGFDGDSPGSMFADRHTDWSDPPPRPTRIRDRRQATGVSP